MAHRVGPSGLVAGIEIDAGLGAQAEAMLHEAGHRQCRVQVHDLTLDEPIPGGPFDVVSARLLLFHLPARVAVLKRLWDAVTPGGHLVVQDYDLRTVSVTPTLPTVEEVGRLLNAAFGAAGCDVHTGTRLPDLFEEAGVGTPDGTDVAGRVEPFATARTMLEAVTRSLLPVAISHGITTAEAAETALTALGEDAARHGGRPLLWPLLVGAWKRRAG
jgi:SAM-dependent methyltransferase